MSICAVIVTYNPDIEVLKKTINELNAINIDCCIIDNTKNSYIPPTSKHNNIIRFEDNYGIAKAQNAGIIFAKEKKYDAIIFLDQDSLIRKESIFSLTEMLNNPKTMIAAPIFKDRDKGFYYKIVDISKTGIRKIIKPEGLCGNKLVSTAISSGTLVRTSVFDIVGLMDEDFFIDYVDTEWCLRCAKLNIYIEINPHAEMIHSIGENSLDFYFFRVPVHSPTRRYYRIRNSFLLLRKPSIPKLLAYREIFFAVAHQALIVTFCKNKLEHCKFMFRALVDAMQKKTGKIV